MCGICVVIKGLSVEQREKLSLGLSQSFATERPQNDSTCNIEDVIGRCLVQNARRGPTVPNGEFSFTVGTTQEKLEGTFRANEENECGITINSSVLHLKGANPTPQPLKLGYKTEPYPRICMAWNGEIFGGELYLECERYPDLSDTQVLGNRLFNVYDDFLHDAIQHKADFEAKVLAVLDNIKGPFATVIYFNAPINQLWIVRDKLGRRSLCSIDPHPTMDKGFLIISSVGPSLDESNYRIPTLNEVGVLGPTIIDLTAEKESFSNGLILSNVRSVKWPTPAIFYSSTFWTNQLAVDKPLIKAREEILMNLEAIMLNSIKRRIRIPHEDSISLMFSGGLDSAILLALTLKILPENVKLDLLNVAFGKPLEAPDRFTALATYDEIQNALPSCSAKDRVNLICIDISKDEILSNELEICSLLYPKYSHMDLNIGSPLYFASRGIGYLVRRDFNRHGNCHWWSQYLIHYLPANTKKRLLNPIISKSVDIPQQCSNCQLVKKAGCSYDLCRLCCERRGRHDPGLHQCKVHHISTVVNDQRQSESLSPPECIYESIRDTTEKQATQLCSCCKSPVVQYQTRSPVVLMGHGADELFGGYGRHATAGRYDGSKGARNEMIVDLGRLWERNLGRDDRCISHWGRESRLPFLDEEVIRFVGEIPFELMRSMEGDKPLLRHLARRLGFYRCSEFQKRAIQFGSRSARQTNQDHFCSNRKAKGVAMYIPRSKQV